MKQIKKLSLSNVIGKLTRNEMRYVMAGSGSDACKKACEKVTYNSECCGGMAVSGDYPQCPNSGGAKVCL